MDDVVYTINRAEASSQDRSWKRYERMFVEESRKPAKKFVYKHTTEPTAVPRSTNKVATYRLGDASGRTVKEFKFVTSFSASPYVTDRDAPRGVPYALIKAYSVDSTTGAKTLMYREYVTVDVI